MEINIIDFIPLIALIYLMSVIKSGDVDLMSRINSMLGDAKGRISRVKYRNSPGFYPGVSVKDSLKTVGFHV